MSAETGLGDVAGVAVLVSEQCVQPAIRLTAVTKIVDQFSMPLIDTERLHIHRKVMVARQAAKELLGSLGPVGVEHVQADG
jgi:hypothetical protein